MAVILIRYKNEEEKAKKQKYHKHHIRSNRNDIPIDLTILIRTTDFQIIIFTSGGLHWRHIYSLHIHMNRFTTFWCYRIQFIIFVVELIFFLFMFSLIFDSRVYYMGMNIMAFRWWIGIKDYAYVHCWIELAFYIWLGYYIKIN